MKRVATSVMYWKLYSIINKELHSACLGCYAVLCDHQYHCCWLHGHNVSCQYKHVQKQSIQHNNTDLFIVVWKIIKQNLILWMYTCSNKVYGSYTQKLYTVRWAKLLVLNTLQWQSEIFKSTLTMLKFTYHHIHVCELTAATRYNGVCINFL